MCFVEGRGLQTSTLSLCASCALFGDVAILIFCIKISWQFDYSNFKKHVSVFGEVAFMAGDVICFFIHNTLSTKIMSSIISYRHVFLTFAILVHLLQASARTVTNVTVDGFEHLTVVNAAKSKFGRFLLGSQPQSALTVPFRIAINTGREAAFEQHVLDISTPGNPKYGQFMSYEDIKNFLRPSPNVTQSLIEWLMRHGIPRSRIQDEGDWLNFDAPITDASKLLNTTFNYFTHESTGIELLRTTQYFVPTRLRQYIKLIVPTTQFQDVVDQRFETARFNAVNIPTGLYPGQQLNVTFCNKTITPQCVLDLYQVQDAAKIASNSRIGVTGFYGTANTTNVQSFYKNFAPYAQNETILVLTEEAQTKQVNTEAELDTEYASSIAYPIPTTFYAGGYDPTVVPFVNLLNYILSLPDGQLPQVITNSYGLAEQYLDQSCKCSRTLLHPYSRQQPFLPSNGAY